MKDDKHLKIFLFKNNDNKRAKTNPQCELKLNIEKIFCKKLKNKNY